MVHCLCWKQFRGEQEGSVGTGQASTWNGMKWFDGRLNKLHSKNLRFFFTLQPGPESHVEVD